LPVDLIEKNALLLDEFQERGERVARRVLPHLRGEVPWGGAEVSEVVGKEP
jgi:hypothetical protein